VKTYLNLGCGERVHPDWINIDIAASQSCVMAHDLVRGIPFETESADVVYHAALFEHVRRENAADFLREIYRALKPGGIIRIGVPDLEKICRTYLEKLEAALAEDKQAANDYDWIMLEMLDQIVRERSGGEMVEYFRCQPLPNEHFVLERIGNEGRKLIETIRRQGAPQPAKSFSVRRWAGTVAGMLRDRLLILLAGRDAVRALAIGRFRLTGEAHHWMYDRFSLARELMAAGFHEPRVYSASQSSIPDWERFHLDTQPDGTVNKPDLLFMEAIKPNKHGHE
jgi:predicted SAM-dependent methyltransferase